MLLVLDIIQKSNTMQSVFDIQEYKPIQQMPTLYFNNTVAMLVLLKSIKRKQKIADCIMASIILVGILVCVYFSINPTQVHDINSFAACAGLY